MIQIDTALKIQANPITKDENVYNCDIPLQSFTILYTTRIMCYHFIGCNPSAIVDAICGPWCARRFVKQALDAWKQRASNTWPRTDSCLKKHGVP